MGHPALILSNILFLLFTHSLGGSYSSDWGGNTRRWIGPDWWANPLQDWNLQAGQATTIAGLTRSLCLTSFTVVTTSKPLIFEMSVNVSISGTPADTTSVGFHIGRRGRNLHWMSSLVDSDKFIEASMFSTGVLKVGRKSIQTTFRFSKNNKITLTLKASRGTKSSRALLELITAHGTVSTQVKKKDILGELALFTGGPGMISSRRPAYVRFTNFTISGPGALDATTQRQLGPILWTQYTLSEDILRLQAQLMPIEQGNEKVKVVLWTLDEEKNNDGKDNWTEIAETYMHPLARTATFTITNWNSTRTTEYVVRVAWNGEIYTRWGEVRAEPQRNMLKLAVFSCDHGYLFPHRPLVKQVLKQNPDLVVFLGDQIYESYGGFKVRRFGSVHDSMLDYLRKFYQFGLSWRDVLRDRPSIIMPDDHDVFQGNLFGQGGRELPFRSPSSRIDVQETQLLANVSYRVDLEVNGNISREAAYDWLKGRTTVPYSYISYGRGGYVMPGAWVSAVEQTQVGHLPTPAKPNMGLPIGIRPYFTSMKYNQVSFAILEDRKFKTGYLTYAEGDNRRWKGEGGSLLGKEQEQFLRSWGNNWTGHDMKIALSQTMFTKAVTHSGPKLIRSSYIFDSGAWPVNARNKAVRLLSNAHALTLHGDQHMGALVELNDGKGNKLKSFMVPGTANGWPRAWWPNGSGGKMLGQFKDDAGHNIRMLAVANPDPGSNLLANLLGDRIGPAELAYKKGSGYGLVTVNKGKKTAKFELYRIGTDKQEMFDGFPLTFEIGAKK